MAFRIQIAIHENDFDDTFYFKELPTKEKLIRAIQDNKALADSYFHESYNKVIAALRLDRDFPEHFSSRTAMRGYPMTLGCSISIWQFELE